MYSLISVAIDCGPLDSPDNGIVRVEGTTVGSFAKYTCNSGFKLSGSDMRTCQATGEWSGRAPVCQCKEFCLIIVELIESFL